MTLCGHVNKQVLHYVVTLPTVATYQDPNIYHGHHYQETINIPIIEIWNFEEFPHWIKSAEFKNQVNLRQLVQAHLTCRMIDDLLTLAVLPAGPCGMHMNGLP